LNEFGYYFRCRPLIRLRRQDPRHETEDYSDAGMEKNDKKEIGKKV
jgi:hypothetical protein